MHCRLCMLLTLLAVLAGSQKLGRTADSDQAVKLSREFLVSQDSNERKRLAARLSAHDGAIDSVTAALSTRSFSRVTAGYHPEQRFSLPALRTKHPDDLLYFHVPQTYTPNRSTGLIVFLHGGGNTSSRRAPR